MKTKLFLLLTVLSVLSTQAQNLTIKGRVTDTSQEAIIAFCNYATPPLFIIGTWVSVYFLLKEKQL